MDAEGSRGKVKVILSIIPRTQIGDFVSIINKYNPRAFYSIEEVKSVSYGVFKKKERNSVFFGLAAGARKGK
jgi:uncharacterized membrane-anchored protein YitT (DUF2179 family)